MAVFSDNPPPDGAVPPAPDEGGGFVGDEQDPQAHPLDEYWAAMSGEELASAIIEREKECHAVIQQRGLQTMWRIAYAQLFGQDPNAPGSFDTQTIGMEGPHGEQLRFRVNEPRSFLQQQVTMATGQRAAFQAVALNTDSSSLALAPVQDAAVDYFYKREMPDSKERELVESDRAYGAGYVFWCWDKFGGEDVKVGVQQVPMTMPDPMDPTGQSHIPSPDGATVPMDVFGPSGAPVASVFHPWEEFHDPRAKKGKHLWRGFRERRSKWELMATFPQYAEQLRSMHGQQSQIEDQIFGTMIKWSQDDLIVRHVVHVPIGDPNEEGNPLKAGRYIVTVESLVLVDARLPVSRKCGLPIVEMMSTRMHDVAFGYADWWDVLCAQQGEDQVISDTLSNLSTFGRLSMYYDEGTEIDFDQVAAGGGVFQKPVGSALPGFAQPAGMPEAAQWMVGYTKGVKQSLTGLNATQRGEPPPNVTSGEMAALFTNLAVEFNSPTQMTLDEARRASGNIIADLILLNAENDLLIEVVGEESRSYVQLFRPDMLKGVRKISMETAPPMMRNPAGRWQLWNMIKDLPPDERGKAIMLVTAGQWRQLVDEDSASFLRIKWENEQLAQGKPVTVSNTDDPTKDLPEHVALYNQLAQNPQANHTAIAGTLQHIQAHLAGYYRCDPMLASLLKFPPPPPPPNTGMVPPDAAPPVPQGHPPGPPGAKGGPQPGPPSKPGESGPAMPTGNTGAPQDRLGPHLPQPAQPPKGAAA